MLSYERAGNGVPIVFVHAFPLDRRMWESQRAAFSHNFQFISIDLPGFGQSSPSTGDTTTMERMASTVWDALSEMGVKEKPVFIGLSMGGYVLFQAFKQAPQRVRAMVFSSTKAGADTDAARENRFKNIDLVQKDGVKALADKMIAGLFGKTSQEAQLPIIRAARGWMESENSDGVCAALRGMAVRGDSFALLSEVKVPILGLAGEEDALIPPLETKKIVEAVSRGDFDILPRAGHLVNLEQPELFNQKILSFLKRRVL